MAPQLSTTRNEEHVGFLSALPFLAIHLLALGALFVGFRWYYPVVAIALYYVRMFGVTAGYHRYFSHRAFKTSRWFQLVLAFLAETSTQKGVLWWAAHHRDHHKFSDQPEDIHSPVQNSLFWSHVGWILSKKYNETKIDRIRDFAKYPELRFLSKHYWLPPVLMAAVLIAIGGLPLALWGYAVSTVLLWHGTFTINSLSHVFGSTRYQSNDASKNNFWLALITMGEGWHNNHHFYQSTANQGWFWWEIDGSYYVLKILSWLGLVWDLRTPPKHIKYAHLSPERSAPSSVPARALAQRQD